MDLQMSGVCMKLNQYEYVGIFVGDTSRLSCESRGIPQKGLQIACVVTIYVNDVICKLA